MGKADSETPKFGELAAAAMAELGGSVDAVLDLVFMLYAESRGLPSTRIEADPKAVRRATEILRPLSFETLDVERMGSFYEGIIHDRRRSGSHYTPRSLTDPTVEDTLRPLLENATRERILSLRICDPAMGSGAFLLAACRALAARLGGDRDAARLVAENCLYGADKDPIAVRLARRSLWLVAGGDGPPDSFLKDNLREGDSLLSDVLQPGFDAIIGNPPWISYVGRAAHPIEPELRAAYEKRFQSFAGYKNLQALFIERAVALLNPGGRLGFIIPSSMAEQQGYLPTRLAHDRANVCDADLTDLGNDSFEGVFQPCMALISTRRPHIELEPPRDPWPIARGDMDAASRALLSKLSGGEPLPAHLFGERGIQTSGEDVKNLAREPDATHTVALRTGGDIEAFKLKSPSFYADPALLGRRLKTPERWNEVKLLIRQTARYPIAVSADGMAFRNSLLAGFEDAQHSAELLLGYLSSTPVRWGHYMRHRDARQGMPQVKIGHLRAIPAPPQRLERLADLAKALTERNAGITPADQDRIDTLVSDAFDLNEEERRILARFRDTVR